MAQSHVEDDVLSYCGSLSGETWSSMRRRTICTLKRHSADDLARRLRKEFQDGSQSPVCCSDRDNNKRLNTSFHNFRFIIAILGGYALGTMIFLRYSLAIAIVSMVNHTALYLEEHPNNTMEDFTSEGYTNTGGEFLWNNEIQQMLMSWYMLAYTLPQLPFTKLVVSMGPRKAMPMCLVVCTISVMLIPVVAHWGWKWVLALRLLQGIGASGIYPGLLNLIELWMPFEETTLGITILSLLQAILMSLSTVIVGYLCEIHWSLAFYLPGVATLLFCVIWLLFVTDTPDECRYISSNELDLICGCSDMREDQVESKKTAGQVKRSISDSFDESKNSYKSEKVEFMQPTWLDVFRVPCFYAYIVMWIFYCCSHSVFLFILPTYLHQFLKITLSINGFYCFLIESGNLISVLWPHPFMQAIQRNFNFSTAVPSRLACAICCLMAGGTWIYIGAFHANQLIIFFINRCFQQSIDVIFVGNLMKNFSKSGVCSEAFSMVNTVGNLSILLGSTLTGYVLDHTGRSVPAWSWIFYALGLAQLIKMTIFCTLIDADPVEVKGRRRKKLEDSEG